MNESQLFTRTYEVLERGTRPVFKPPYEHCPDCDKPVQTYHARNADETHFWSECECGWQHQRILRGVEGE